MEAASIDAPAVRAAWDRAAARTPGIDRWCSRTPWLLAVHQAFQEEPGTRSLDGVIVGAADGCGVAFARHTLEDGTPALLPLDAVWAFGSTVVADGTTGSLESLAADAVAWIVADPSWRLSAWSGTTPETKIDDALIAALARHGRVHHGPSTDRCVASLDGGVEGWLARRSRAFRRNLRQAERRAETRDTRFEIVDDVAPDHLLMRLHAIERSSWKGQSGSGIESPDMAALYDHLLRSLDEGARRATIAQLDGRDVGFVLGGVLSDTYRGLQISFTDDMRALSIGRLLQWHEVRRLCAEGVMTYDLGMDIPYKREWAESIVSTRTLLCVR